MTFPHLSRRDMLLASAVAGTSLCWSRKLDGADKLEPLSFVIVSDTHLGRSDNLNAENRWRTAIAEINELDARFVLHLGDVVDAGRKAQYPIYAETRKTLNKPIHEIPGNHDPQELFKKHIHPEIDRFVDDGGVRFVLFDNADRVTHDGIITPAQLDWLEQTFADAAAKDLKIVLCCHVPIHTNKHPDRGWYVKPDNGQTVFYTLHKKYEKQILATLHGHFHNGIRGWRDHGTLAEILCPSVCYNNSRKLQEHIDAGRASGFFVDELRAGYVVTTLGAGELTLRYKPLGAELNGEYSAKWE